MDPRNHPDVRHGTGWIWSQWSHLAVLLVVLGLLLLRDPTGLHVLGAIALFMGAGLSLFIGHKLVKDLRHEYRYQDDEPTS
jgi:hypothetical protein